MTGNGREGGCRAAQRHREDFLGGFEEGLCVVQEGKAPRGAEVACSDTCFHGHVGQGTGGVSYPEKCGERMDPLPRCGGGLSGPREAWALTNHLPLRLTLPVSLHCSTTLLPGSELKPSMSSLFPFISMSLPDPGLFVKVIKNYFIVVKYA